MDSVHEAAARVARRASAAFLTALLVAPPGRAQDCRDSSTAFRRIITEFQSRQRNTALVAGVLHGGRVAYLETTGSARLEDKTPADAGMAFSIASITKAFTGVALLKLVETGQVNLDADVRAYVPTFPRHPSGRTITVPMLAHHLGSLRHWGPERNEAVYARHFANVDDILSLFRDSAWVAGLAPGERYAYSSYGYNVLAMVIQAASGVRYQQYLRAVVLQPLNISPWRSTDLASAAPCGPHVTRGTT